MRMEMSYNKAWKLITGLNLAYANPLVTLSRGGKSRGGAELTEAGRRVLSIYEELVASAELATKDAMKRMSCLLADDELKSSEL